MTASERETASGDTIYEMLRNRLPLLITGVAGVSVCVRSTTRMSCKGPVRSVMLMSPLYGA